MRLPSVPPNLTIMTRSELVQALVEKLSHTHPKLSARDIELAANVIFEGLSNTLVKRGRIEIRGFGSFVLNSLPPRKARNPKTGATVMLPAREFPHFKAGNELRERVNLSTAPIKSATK